MKMKDRILELEKENRTLRADLDKTVLYSTIFLVVIFPIIILAIISVPIVQHAASCHEETRIMEVGCHGAYPTHPNMLCEDGVQGDVKNEYGGIVWYCDLVNFSDKTKTCMYKETVCG